MQPAPLAVCSNSIDMKLISPTDIIAAIAIIAIIFDSTLEEGVYELYIALWWYNVLLFTK